MFDVEFLEPADTGRREVEFDTFYFLHVEGDDTEVYYQVNGFWIFESISYGPKKAAKIFEAIEILGAVFDIIGDIEQGEDYDWSYSTKP